MVRFLEEVLAGKFVFDFYWPLGYEEALWSKKLEISHVSQNLKNDRQILVLSKLSYYYCTKSKKNVKKLTKHPVCNKLFIKFTGTNSEFVNFNFHKFWDRLE